MDAYSILRTFAGSFNGSLIVMVTAAAVAAVFFSVFIEMLRSPGR